MIVLGFLVGITFALLFYPRTSGGKPAISPTLYPVLYNGSVILPLSRYTAVHCHHWLLLLPLFIYCVLLQYNEASSDVILFLSGTLAALIVHGLLYTDSMHILEENPYSIPDTSTTTLTA